MFRKFIAIAFLLLVATSAFAQSGIAVKQSGNNVTPNTVPWWITSGVIGSGVSAADSPISSFGATGPICSLSARQSSGAWYALCIQANNSSNSTISLQNYGTATPRTLNFVINGTTYSFPFTSTGVVGPSTTTIGHPAVWGNISGTLLADEATVPAVFTNTVGITVDSARFWSNDSSNLFIGQSAGNSNLTPPCGSPPHCADLNTFVGPGAGQNNTSGFANTFFGTGAGSATTTGDSNTYLSTQAGLSGTTANSNVGVGVDAIFSNVAGANITAVGHHVASAVLSPNNSVYIGAEVNKIGVGAVDTTMAGYRAGYNTNASGIGNSFYGNLSAFPNTSGSLNSYFGKETGQAGTTASSGAYFGYRAGWSNIVGNNNVFLGPFSGFFETGSNKLFIDNQTRSNEADARVKALLYGVFDASPSNQTLAVNGQLNVLTNVKIGSGVGSPSGSLMVNTPGGSAASIQLKQDGFASWIIKNPISSATTLDFSESNVSAMTLTNTGVLNVVGSVGVGTSANSGIGTMILNKQAFSSLTACSSTIEGAMAAITDSSTVTWGATITGSSTNHVLGYCDGTNWTVAGK